ncbi:MAG TPA: hypothetical protein VN540_06640, partial [Clostridia bacterium]|nr:hypothetical protein [Clostridia bacterium]
VFKTGSINHSDISPRRLVYYSKRGGRVSSKTGAQSHAYQYVRRYFLYTAIFYVSPEACRLF